MPITTDYFELRKGEHVAWRDDELKPEWLASHDRIDVSQGDLDWSENLMAEWVNWPVITKVRFEVPYWAVEPLKRGMKPHTGSDGPPDDWDGGEVLLRNGEREIGYESPRQWSNDNHKHDIIGYHTKPVEAAPDADLDLAREVVQAQMKERFNNKPLDYALAAIKAADQRRPELPPGVTVELVEFVQYVADTCDDEHYVRKAQTLLAELDRNREPVDPLVDEAEKRACFLENWDVGGPDKDTRYFAAKEIRRFVETITRKDAA